MLAPPPPAYTPSSHHSAAAPPPRASLLGLPQHLLLAVLSHLPLPALVFSLRLTCRPLHLIATALSREQLLPSWRERVRSKGWSTAAGTPLSYEHHSSTGGVLSTRSRETAVFDIFIAAVALEAQRRGESTLLILGHSSAELDLFGAGGLQPRARVEDLVIRYGREDGVIYAEGDAGRFGVGDGKVKPVAGGGGTILSTDLSIQLSPSKARLLLPFRGSAPGRVVEKVALEVPREEGERLEVVADRVVEALKGVRVWREEPQAGSSGKGWYETG